MHLSTKPILAAAAAIALGLSGALVSATDGLAKGEPEPKPKPASTVDCSLAKNKNKPACRRKTSGLSDDQLYAAGYWLARSGDYTGALMYLERAENPNDPRFLTYIGFSLRKLGEHDRAMAYYGRALAIDPNFTVARAYLGEAYLTKGDVVAARRELAEVASRCGTHCPEHAELVDAFTAAGVSLH
ncbi:MAG TPA: tetratricopeptide repeat protein [Hyphomicrobiaceae bacterium]|nr:tetratricopeptide repeat protein [Hyphomicrobiaceae bacterium]